MANNDYGPPLPRFSLRAVFVVIAIIAPIFGMIAWRNEVLRRSRAAKVMSRAAKSELARISERHGGSISEGQINGEVDVDLSGATLSAEEMRRLSELFGRVVPEYFDHNGLVQLRLSNAKLAGNLSDILNERVISLELKGVPINDEDLATILERSPNLGMLDLRNTKVTMMGLRKLAGLKGLIRLWITRQNVGDAELEELQKLFPSSALDVQ